MLEKKQRYQCKIATKDLSLKTLTHKKTYIEYNSTNASSSVLARRLDLSNRTLLRQFDKIDVKSPQKQHLKEIIVLGDASYYGHGFSFSVLVFKDALSGKFLWWKFIYHKERIEDYLEGLAWLRNNGYSIVAMVCDGLRGLIQAVYPLNVQLCQFHIQSYVKSRITSNPKTPAGVALLGISRHLSYASSSEFKELLEEFYAEFADFLNERSTNEQGKSFYTHRRLRSAYFSLKRHLPELFTFECVERLPKTNNKIEGSFKDLKTKLRVHNGLNQTNKERFISWYFFIKNGSK